MPGVLNFADHKSRHHSGGTDAIKLNDLEGAPGVAKVWAFIAAAGTLTAGYNVASITDTGTGDRTIVIATDFSSANYAIADAYHDTGGAVLPIDLIDSALAVGSWRHRTFSASNLVDLISSSVAFGDQ